AQRAPPAPDTNPVHLPQPEPPPVPPRKRPRQVNDAPRVHPRRRHLVQQRLERAVHVPVNQRHLHPRPRQLRHRRQPGKPRPHDDHPRRISPRHPAPPPPHSSSPPSESSTHRFPPP